MGVTVLGIQHHFYPRSPCGERLGLYLVTEKDIPISIHALLAESDMRQRRIELGKFRFLSTLSLRRATTEIWDVIAVMTISIHALLAESDSSGR